MTRWVAFDEEGTGLAAAASGMAVSFQRGEALDNALNSSNPAIVLLPGGSESEVFVVEVRRNATAVPPEASSQSASTQGSNEPLAYEASGFLGLRDEPIFEQEPAAKKKWWQRLLD